MADVGLVCRIHLESSYYKNLCISGDTSNIVVFLVTILAGKVG